MDLVIEPGPLKGTVSVPASKSHTLRALYAAALAEGASTLRHPLDSPQSRALIRGLRGLGAAIEAEVDEWRVEGGGGSFAAPDDVIHVQSSTTAMQMCAAAAGLLREGACVLTGDAHVRAEDQRTLVEAMNRLGARVHSTRRNGKAPFVVEGRLSGGEFDYASADGRSLSPLLMTLPLADGASVIRGADLEDPFIETTLHWIRRQGGAVEQEGGELRIEGSQQYAPIDEALPADFASGAWFLAAGALPGNDVTVRRLDAEDPQGDRRVLDLLTDMGAAVEPAADGTRCGGRTLGGGEGMLSPDGRLLPLLAAVACLGEGVSRFRLSEPMDDSVRRRLSAACRELRKLGASVEEGPEHVEVSGGGLSGGEVDGSGDAAVIMAVAVAATAADGQVIVRGCEPLAQSYPAFVETMEELGGRLHLADPGGPKV
jgi:3-phosphoshikimate 1-carboxyvinyltransferase